MTPPILPPALAEKLDGLRREHYADPDRKWSCQMLKREHEPVCICGADAHNARLDALRKAVAEALAAEKAAILRCSAEVGVRSELWAGDITQMLGAIAEDDVTSALDFFADAVRHISENKKHARREGAEEMRKRCAGFAVMLAEELMALPLSGDAGGKEG